MIAKVNEGKSLLKNIVKRMSKLIGHVFRHKLLRTNILESKEVECKVRREKQEDELEWLSSRDWKWYRILT